MAAYDLDAAIRKVPDHPKPGVLFYDITSIFTNPPALEYCLERFEARYRGAGLGAVAAIESRGFLFGAPLARSLGLPLVLVRKAGKLPGKTIRREYELEYGVDTIEVHEADVQTAHPTLIVDDLIATGGTVAATIQLFEEAGARVHEVCCVIGLPFLGFRDRISPVNAFTLLDYEGE